MERTCQVQKLEDILQNQNYSRYSPQGSRMHDSLKKSKKHIGLKAALVLASALGITALVEKYAPADIQPSAIVRFISDTIKENQKTVDIYINNQRFELNYQPQTLPQNSISYAVLQWEKTIPCMTGENHDVKTKYDVGTLYLLKDNNTVVKRIEIVGGFYEDKANKTWSRDGEPSSPHEGVFQISWIPKPDWYTKKGVIPGGSGDNPFGVGEWLMFKVNSDGYVQKEYERFQMHGNRINEDNIHYLPPTWGCMRMHNKDIQETFDSYFINGKTRVQVTTVPGL
jgi:hypothetical protein